MTLVFLIVMIILACFGLWKAALIMLGVTLVIDFLILILRVGARATLEDNVFSLKIIAGPIKLKLLPKDEDKASKPKKEKPEKKKEEKREKKEEEEGEKKKPKIKVTLELVTTALKAVGELLSRLRRKIAIDKLTIHYTVASDDPASAAMTFGYASAGVNALMPVLENTFKIKDSDVGAAVDFEAAENVIFIDAQLTIAVWEIIYIGLAAWPVVKVILAGSKKGKVDKNGQASDQ